MNIPSPDACGTDRDKPTKRIRRTRMWVKEGIRSFVSQEEEREIEFKRQEIERDERRSCQEINRSITSTSCQWLSETQDTFEKRRDATASYSYVSLEGVYSSFPFQLSSDPLKTWTKRSKERERHHLTLTCTARGEHFACNLVLCISLAG